MSNLKTLGTYKNGNVFVTIFEDGTKIREYKGKPSPIFPESIDLKITEYCDLGCYYCHESATKLGKHADINDIIKILNGLPAGVEIAIGGGNPLAHPNLVDLLIKLKVMGLVANITVNQGHLKRYFDLIKYFIKEKLIHGLGISVNNKYENQYQYIESLSRRTNNIVLHLIAGVNDLDLLERFKDYKILVLGYKYFGFGENYYNQSVYQNLLVWYKNIHKYLGKVNLSFDNLALKQLNIKQFLTKEAWSLYYMGDDGQYTMYIDAVKKEAATSSTSRERIKINPEDDIVNIFKRKEENYVNNN